MNPSDVGASTPELSKTSLRFAQLRDLVVGEWVARVSQAIPATAGLGRPVLTNTLPIFYDDIAQALSSSYPRALATTDNNLASAHGRERAVTTEYSLDDVVHELQIFRQVVFSVAESDGLELTSHHRNIINSSIDEEIRDSVTAFSSTLDDNAQMLIARLSHDLRNPLHVANAVLHVIEVKTTDSDIGTLAKRAIRNIAEVDKMIQAILDTAVSNKRTKLRLQLEEFEMKFLVEEICSDFNLMSGRCVVIGESVTGYWSRHLMKRALENLISNAHKYGSDDCSVHVNVGCVEGRLLLGVHNEGTPISPDEISRIFSAFERGLENVDVKGWGLGLPFVQHVAESHQGTVIVDSAEGRGTTFTISIPVDCRPKRRFENSEATMMSKWSSSIGVRHVDSRATNTA